MAAILRNIVRAFIIRHIYGPLIIISRFLLPALHIRMVLEQPTVARRRKALATLPSQLTGAYAQMVNRIQTSSSMSGLGMRVLVWLHLAKRPLKLEEIQHALAVERGDIKFDVEAIPAKKRLLDCCLGLVIVDEETSTIRLVHYTLEEYFRVHSSTVFPYGYSTAAEICLTYLNLRELSVECKTYANMMQQLKKFPFLEYASCHWGHYAAEAEGVEISGLATNILLSKGKRLPHISLQVLYYDVRGVSEQLPEQLYAYSIDFLGVHAAAHFGLEAHMPVLGDRQGWNAPVRDIGSPLSCATSAGHEAVVRMLLEQEEVDVNSRGRYDQTPLLSAAQRGNEAVVRLLVQRKDVNANSKGLGGTTPLLSAAVEGYEDIARLLLERGDVDANARDRFGRPALSCAAEAGHEAVVRLLLEWEGVDFLLPPLPPFSIWCIVHLNFI